MARNGGPGGISRQGAVLFACLVLLGPGSRDAAAAGRSPYSVYRSMSAAELSTMQVKFTWCGEQTAACPSVLLFADGRRPDIRAFTPFHRPDLWYLNDRMGAIEAGVTANELWAVIIGLGRVPRVAAGGVDSAGYVSFSLAATIGGRPRGFEAVIGWETGPPLFGELLAALRNNPPAREAVREFGCNHGMLPSDTPTSLEGCVRIVGSPIRREVGERPVYVQTVTLTNISNATIRPPLSLVVVRHGNCELIEHTGETCNIHPPGFPYLNLLEVDGLRPGGSIRTVLHFWNTSEDEFDVRFRAFAGPGTR